MELLELINQFMINVIIILYTGSSISTYIYHHLIIGKLLDYEKANTETILRAISVFNRDIAFQNKDINKKKIKTLNETLLNTFNNLIHNKISYCYY